MNIDSDKSKWQAYLSENPSEKKVKEVTTTNAPTNSNLTGLESKYIVIDPNGSIYNFDAPKPGTPALRDLISKIGSYE